MITKGPYDSPAGASEQTVHPALGSSTAAAQPPPSRPRPQMKPSVKRQTDSSKLLETLSECGCLNTK